MPNFYTIGLPRSRSLWLSMFLQTDKSDCYHEGLTVFGSRQLPGSTKTYVGSCDTNPINPVHRHGPTIKIVRDLGDTVDSIVKSFDNPFSRDFRPFVESWISVASDSLDKIDGVTVDFEDLSNIDCLRGIYDFLIPDVEFVLARALKMVDTRTQVINRDLSESFKNTSKSLGLNGIEELYDYVRSV